MVMPPFFLAPPVGAILRHIEAVANSVSAPIIVQYAPLQTGRVIDAQVFVNLHRFCPNVTHIKVDLIPSGEMITALTEASGGLLKSLTGYMGLHLPDDVARGGVGCMLTVSLGRMFLLLWNLLLAGSRNSWAFHSRLLPILNFMMQSVEMLIACEKILLLCLGHLGAEMKNILSILYAAKPSS
jgi:4-hydroxy-tetrahydrodipicolinate synthase